MLTEQIASALAARLEGGTVRRTGGIGFEHRVEGRRGGISTKTTVRHANDNTGWSVEAGVARVPLFAVLSRKGLGDAAAIARGAISAVPLGGDIDREWVLEGAPGDTAKAAFEKLVQKDLSGLDVAFTIDSGRAIVAPPSSKIVQLDVDELERALDLLVVLVTNVAEVAQGRRASGSNRHDDEAQIARLRALRERVWQRASWPVRAALMLFGTVLAAAILAGVYYGLGIDAIVGELRR